MLVNDSNVELAVRRYTQLLNWIKLNMNSIRPFRDIKRRPSKEINVGKVKIGGQNLFLFNQ